MSTSRFYMCTHVQTQHEHIYIYICITETHRHTHDVWYYCYWGEISPQFSMCKYSHDMLVTVVNSQRGHELSLPTLITGGEHSLHRGRAGVNQ